MGPEDLKMLRETYRLTLENNKMLRKMRRSALIHTVVWLIIYAALIVAPIWFYMTYLDGAVQQLIKSYKQVQGTGQQAQADYQNFHNAVQNVLSHLPGAGSAATSSPTQ